MFEPHGSVDQRGIYWTGMARLFIIKGGHDVDAGWRFERLGRLQVDVEFDGALRRDV